MLFFVGRIFKESVWPNTGLPNKQSVPISNVVLVAQCSSSHNCLDINSTTVQTHIKMAKFEPVNLIDMTH